MKVKWSKKFSINHMHLNTEVNNFKTIIFKKIPYINICLQKLICKLKHNIKLIKSKITFKTLNHIFKNNYSIYKKSNK